MPYLIGLAITLVVAALDRLLKLDRRSFYTAVLIVVAHYYVLFALIVGAKTAMLHELIPMSVFLLFAVFGALRSRWLLALGLAGHGVFDLFHHHLITNPGVPAWWPQFCMTFDVAAGAYVAFILLTGKAKS